MLVSSCGGFIHLDVDRWWINVRWIKHLSFPLHHTTLPPKGVEVVVGGGNTCDVE
jgi:hypothetical protein